MKKPRYKSDVFAFIFLFLGLGFVMFSTLSFTNIIKPTAHSQVQDPKSMGLIFGAIGISFLATQLVLKYFSYRQKRLDNELISAGTKLAGKVEEIILLKGIKFGGNSPYVVCYSYTYQGRDFQNKSFLLWDKPNLIKGDDINIYVNEDGKSTFKMYD